MRVLVTGAAGFIGSHLCEGLLAQGHSVLGVDKLTDFYAPTDKQRNLARARDHDDFRFLHADVLNPAVVEHVEQADLVYHLGGQPGVDGSWGSFPSYLRENVETTHRLLQLVRRSGAPLVLASSSSVYGDATVSPTPETAERRPNNPYAVTKVACEDLVLLHHRLHDQPFAVLRLFTVYGPRQRPDMMVRQLVGAALEQRPFVLTGDGTQSRDMTFVDDAVAAFLALTSHDLSAGVLLNIAGRSTHPLREVVDVVEDLTGTVVEVRPGPAREGDVRTTHAAVDSAQQLLGWAAQTALRDGLQQQIEWQAERYDGRARTEVPTGPKTLSK